MGRAKWLGVEVMPRRRGAFHSGIQSLTSTFEKIQMYRQRQRTMEFYGQMMGEFGKAETKEDVLEIFSSPESMSGWKATGGDAGYPEILNSFLRNRPSQKDVDTAAKQVAKDKVEIERKEGLDTAFVNEVEKFNKEYADMIRGSIGSLPASLELKDIPGYEEKDLTQNEIDEKTLLGSWRYDQASVKAAAERQNVEAPTVTKETKLTPEQEQAIRVLDSPTQFSQETYFKAGKLMKIPEELLVKGGFRKKARMPVEWEEDGVKQVMPLNLAEDEIRSLNKQIEALAGRADPAGMEKIKSLMAKKRLIIEAIVKAGGYVPKETETKGEGGEEFDIGKTLDELEIK